MIINCLYSSKIDVIHKILISAQFLRLFACFTASSVCISKTQYVTAVDLSKVTNVTQCEIVLPSEGSAENYGIYTTLGCHCGSSGRYVYIYKSGFGYISLIEVLVLKEARLNGTTGACGESIYLHQVGIYTDGLVQACSSSSALAIELLQSCALRHQVTS